MDGPSFVYILASKRNGTLYVGVTNNLARRMLEHKASSSPDLPGNTASIYSSISRRLIPFSKRAPGSTR